jgi:hypothetical protein
MNFNPTYMLPTILYEVKQQKAVHLLLPIMSIQYKLNLIILSY